jgi:hypothetical protein
MKKNQSGINFLTRINQSKSLAQYNNTLAQLKFLTSIFVRIFYSIYFLNEASVIERILTEALF